MKCYALIVKIAMGFTFLHDSIGRVRTFNSEEEAEQERDLEECPEGISIATIIIDEED